MSLKKKELTEKNLYTLEFSVEKDVFEAAVSKVFAKEVKKISVPGFRKGKAPRSVIEKMYGKGVFYEDAINECIPDAFEAALKESELEMVGKPEFEVVSIDENEGVLLSAKVYVKPEVKIEGYAGIEAPKTTKRVTKKEIDEEIDRVRERNARTIDVTDRAAELNDIANIDFDGYVDGVAFDGGKGDNFDLKLGSGQFIPGFEEQIVGKNIGETFDVNVTFPADYHAENLAGKAAVFKTKINGLKKTELPELDDEFVKDVSEFNTLDEYKADIKAKIQDRNAKQAEAELENKLIDALIEKLEADIPEAMFVAETENYLRDYDNRLRMQGMDLSTYFKYTGMNLDMLRAQLRPQAEKQVKLRLALEKIAELENVTVSDEEIEAEYKRISEAYNVPVEEVKSMVDAKGISEDLKVKAAMDFVKSKAVTTKN
ncbi:MAG: trigger factor [Ruminococcaceae bacterium]|nr:trigger factor [Oscillospiraceae bacterium]